MKTMKKVICTVLVLLLCLSVTAFAAPEDEPLNYVVLGDSIGWGAGVLNSTEAVFGRIVADTNGYNFRNDAVNGYTTGNLLAHLEKEDIAADVAKADIISISIGGNNYLLGDMRSLIAQAGEGDYSGFDAIAENFYKDFCAIIAKIKELNPDVQILMQTLYNPGADSIKDIYQAGADRLNAGYRRYLDENPGAYELLEVADAFVGHPEYVAADYIHPSAKGNEVIAKIVLEKLCELGLGENTEPVILHEGINQTEIFSFKFIAYLFRSLFARIKAIFAGFGNLFG